MNDLMRYRSLVVPVRTPATFLLVVSAALATSACPVLERPPEIDPWLLCEECVDGERESVVSLGEDAIPWMADALRGPSPRRVSNIRLQAAESYARLVAATPSGDPGRTQTQYVDHYTDNYVATFQSRAAKALGDIGTDAALDTLRTALAAAEARDYRDDVVTEIVRALGVAGSGSGWSRIAVGERFSCGVFHGRTYCWGGYASGQVGHGRVQGGDPGQSLPVPTLGTMSFRQVSGGADHACGTTPTRRTFCWGAQVAGRLGNGTRDSDTLPIPVALVGPRLDTVAVGRAHACGIGDEGEAFCWGSDIFGQLGDGPTPHLDDFSPEPVLVAGGIAFRTISADAGGDHPCGVAIDGTGWCWGNNSEGQLGSPVSGGGFQSEPTRVFGEHVFSEIVAGGAHSCAVTASQTVLCWGDNSASQIGAGPASDTARVVSGLPPTTFASVAAGAAHSCALSTGGAAVCWGANDLGQLGRGSVGDTLSNPAPVSGGSVWRRIVASVHTCGITGAGELFCWGRGADGQIGNGDWEFKTVPETVSTPGSP
ncbi:MAG: hypothetical protein R3195_10155 [Gemmatimonadota bacterium]|nr:hypothetical protein [Gemmatimonadota bacterium]